MQYSLSLVGTQTRSQRRATTIDIFVNGSSNLPYKYDVLCTTSGVGNAGTNPTLTLYSHSIIIASPALTDNRNNLYMSINFTNVISILRY